MNEERVTLTMSLCPVPDVVQIEHTERTTHSHHDTEVNKEVFEPLGAVKTTMYQQAM